MEGGALRSQVHSQLQFESSLGCIRPYLKCKESNENLTGPKVYPELI